MQLTRRAQVSQNDLMVRRTPTTRRALGASRSLGSQSEVSMIRIESSSQEKNEQTKGRKTRGGQWGKIAPNSLNAAEWLEIAEDP